MNDGSWSQAGYEGLKLIESQLGAKIAFTASVPEADFEKVFRQYATDGFNFIIGHGGEFISAAEVVAKEFPRTKFALVTTYPGNNKNLGAVAFRVGESGYLAGFLAALKTKTKKVAYIVGYDYPVYKEETPIFKRGAKAVNPSVQVSIKFLQSWTDAAKAKKVARDLVESGTDVLAINADDAGIAAIKDITKKQGVFVIGWAKDQHALAPGKILTSLVQHVPVLVLEAATLVKQGRWEGKQYKYGLREGAHDLAPFQGLLTPEEEKTVMTVRDDILTGKIDISP
jgi:basic membrane protein A